MRFQVPQFIEVEDKVFGPFTFKQFVYLAGGAGLSVILYFFLPLLIALPLIAIVAGLSLALAFYKINNKPFLLVLESSFKYLVSNKLYIWRKEPKKIVKKKEEEKGAPPVYIPKLSDSKLKDLAWSLDVQEQQKDNTNQ